MIPSLIRFCPWLDRRGRLSPLRTLTFAGLFVPGLDIGWRLYAGLLGANPLESAIHLSGLWAIRFLFISLTLTPLTQLSATPRFIEVRRMVGVAACAYAFGHLGLYAAQQSFDLARVVSEIVHRIYLTIGFAALLGLGVLTATSTDAMVKRLGAKRWRQLHKLAYLIGLIATVHFFLQAKLEVKEPTIMFGLLAWLMGYRLLRPFFAVRGWGLAGASAGLALLAGLATALGEALYFNLKTGVAMARVLGVNLSAVAGLRPGPLVALIALSLVILALALRLALNPARLPSRAGPASRG
ncbi:MAG: sulfoxide reductase heme-binding subunit YedZ [Parvibaculaceae bacterium]|nr:sulfoxide reductase heme-binding subunit YedZ [Parvibaculaceae bacterium]